MRPVRARARVRPFDWVFYALVTEYWANSELGKIELRRFPACVLYLGIGGRYDPKTGN